MITLLIVLFLILAVGSIAGFIIFLKIKERIQDQKNYERGLKMVPLLIHLPPPSEDIEGNGRDTRDVTDENISKAQVIYNIIASTAQKSFKARMHGQRHFGFEIVGTKGFAYFYAAVPLALVEVVKQAVVSAYPAARLEEVAEYNIFSPVGKISGTVGGELHLKEPFAYPIATFQDVKRDAMQALLNSLSSLDKEDGAGIQILMRPADSSWRKTANGLAGKKRKGKESKKGFDRIGDWIRQLGTALVKPPEAKEDKGGGGSNLSSLEQANLDAIEDKTRHPAYEVLIRVVVSSNVNHRAQAILNNVVAAFSLFDAPGKNGFKFAPAKDTEELATSYILRLFPQKQTDDILNAVELATIFHFPDYRSIPTSQLERQGSKQVDGPRNVPDKGLLLGYNIFRGVKKAIRVDVGDRQRHMYAVGQTGTGKSTYLENLAYQDMMNGDGFAFVDPHGDTAERLLSMVPKERTEDVIYFCPSDMDYPMGLNLFEFNTPDQKDFLIQEALNMLYKLYDPQHQGIMGPRYEHLFRNAALTVMADPNGGTFVDIPKLFRDPQYVKQKLQYVNDQQVIDFWNKEMPQSQRSNEFGEVVSWFVSKFGAFLSNEMMRNIIGQTKSSFNLRDIMDNKKILLVNLSKGRTGELNSKLLGMVFVMKFQAAAMSRANVPESERPDFALYVDEFQNFSTDSFATILSEARKYHLNLIVANQFTTQLTEEVRDAVFGNIGTIVAFRVGQDEDAEALAKRFRPAFDSSDLLRMPNYNAVVRTLIGGVPTQPFSMATLPPLGNPSPEVAAALKQLSAAKHGRPKAVVEKEIIERLATQTPPPPAAPAPGANPYGAPGAAPYGPPRTAGVPGAPAGMPPANPYGPPTPPQPPAKGPVGTGSFLGEWMDRRDGPFSMRPSPWGNQPKAPGAPGAPAAAAPRPATFNPGPAPTPAPRPFGAPPAQAAAPQWTPPAPMPAPAAPSAPVAPAASPMMPPTRTSPQPVASEPISLRDHPVSPSEPSHTEIDLTSLSEVTHQLQDSDGANPAPGQTIKPTAPSHDVNIDENGNLQTGV